MVDEKLFFYEEWELKACVDGALLAAQIDRVNRVPFTYQQLSIFKHKLDEVTHNGLPCPPPCLGPTQLPRSGCGPHGHAPPSSTHKATLSP